MKRFFSVIFIVVIFSGMANAQKLPNVQQVSLRAPVNIKIDGKGTEWGDKFQAYNSSTELFYTLGNDKDNLYLIVSTDKPRVFEKIIAVGITFTVNKTGLKDYKAINNAVITFPLLDVSTGYSIIKAAGIKTVNVPVGQAALAKTSNQQEADSLKTVAGKLLKSASKTIKLTGFKGLTDTLSIYNEYNINAGIDYDKSGNYTYELQIPLKLLGLSINEAKAFSYSIKLRSRLEDKKPGTLTVFKYDKEGNTYNPNQDLDATTDFWGEYTLAK